MIRHAPCMDVGFTPVESSAVDALGFIVTDCIEIQDGTRVATGSLYVRFKSGAVHRYDRQILAVYTALIDARSVGKSLWKVLTPGTGVKVVE